MSYCREKMIINRLGWSILLAALRSKLNLYKNLVVVIRIRVAIRIQKRNVDGNMIHHNNVFNGLSWNVRLTRSVSSDFVLLQRRTEPSYNLDTMALRYMYSNHVGVIGIPEKLVLILYWCWSITRSLCDNRGREACLGKPCRDVQTYASNRVKYNETISNKVAISRFSL